MPFWERKEKENSDYISGGFAKTVEEMELEKRIQAEKQVIRDESKSRKARQAREEELMAKGNLAGRIFLWVMAVILTVLLAYGFSSMLCRTYQIQDGSMEPTLSAGQTYLINSAAYRFGEPKRGDIVVFNSGKESDATMHVKRVIGLPGETIQIVNGQIRIDGQTYTGNGNFPTIIDAGLAKEPVQLAAGEYFVLGDNRNGSEDSRYASVGNVNINQMVGKIWFRISPLTRIGFT